MTEYATVWTGDTRDTRSKPDSGGIANYADRYTLASLRYDLSKLRAKGLIAKLPNPRRYQLLPQGYAICLIFLKLFERI
jgi:hypothetical protein